MRPPRVRCKPLREDEVSDSNPRCLPSSGDIRAHARTVTDLECGHVMGFRIDPELSAYSLVRAALRFWRSLAAYELDPRPRTPPKSGEMDCARFSESSAAKRLLQRNDYDARAHPSSVRSSPRLERRALLEPRRPPRLPSLPARLLSKTHGLR